eukprot:TRINITY_DN814_c0_g1_i2.p1 TRINITY_DN814_c0_g1~~TRINITY_DN814_c0_g1_i2.p1  ORF type:complete len:820 (+),score=186.04 TRINITY_DN814_c0_g1_i2:183-2462(+)
MGERKRSAPARPIVLDDDEEHEPKENIIRVGSFVRLKDLQGAVALNGQAATVMSQRPDGRYEVRLQQDNEVKAVKACNLVCMSTVAEVEYWRDVLINGQPGQPPAALLEAIRRLQALTMTRQLLAQTGVGKVVNVLGRKAPPEVDPGVSEACRALVQRWREAYKEEKETGASAPGSGAIGAQASSSSTGRPLPVAPSAGTPVPGPNTSVKPGGKKCMARVWGNGVGGQCSRPPRAGGDLCAQHCNLLETNGCLPHGRVDGEVPTEKREEFHSGKVGFNVESAVPMSGSVSSGFKALQSTEDVATLLNTMKNAPSDRMRMGTLSSLDCSRPELLRAFVSQGGLGILGPWLRKHSECRYACLLVLHKMPITSAKDLEAGHLAAAVTTLSRLDGKEEMRRSASELLDRWRAAGLIGGGAAAAKPPAPTPPVAAEGSEAGPPPASPAPAPASAPVPRPTSARPSSASPPEAKRPRLDAGATAASRATSANAVAPGAAPVAAAAPPAPPAAVGGSHGGGGAARSETEVPPQTALLPEQLPEQYKDLDPRIAKVLAERPMIADFLKKHPLARKTMHPDHLQFLTRNLQKAKDATTRGGSVPSEGSKRIVMTNLPADIEEDDIERLLDQHGIRHGGIELPRESRRKRPVGTAFVKMRHRHSAVEAVRRLENVPLKQHVLTVELEDNSEENAAATKKRRIQWADDSELFSVAVYNPNESVDEFADKFSAMNASPASWASSEENTAKFQAWARAEREMEAKPMLFGES